jgi:sugar O-acyltransferase (sialic acid O-acetyltransferase NeuD family)
MKIAIFGGEGAGEIAAQTIARLAQAGADIALAGYLNDRHAPDTPLLGGTVLGAFDAWASLPGEVKFLAPLHKAKEMPARLERIRRLMVPDARWASLVDPGAVITDGAQIGAGSMVGPFAVVGPSCRLGRHVGCWPGAQVGHNATLADFAFIGRAAIVSGYCNLGTGAYVGAGAVIRDHTRIGDFAVIGAGAVVVADVPDHAIVAGNPARAIMPRD